MAREGAEERRSEREVGLLAKERRVICLARKEETMSGARRRAARRAVLFLGLAGVASTVALLARDERPRTERTPTPAPRPRGVARRDAGRSGPALAPSASAAPVSSLSAPSVASLESIEDALEGLDALSPAERGRVLVSSALGLERRLAAAESAADPSREAMATRALFEAVRASLVVELGPAGLRERLVAEATPADERLLVAASALEQGWTPDAVTAVALARLLAREASGVERPDARRIAVLAALPEEARVLGLSSALGAGLLDARAAGRAASELARGPSLAVATDLLVTARATPSSMARVHLVLGATLVLERLPAAEARLAGEEASRLLEDSVVQGEPAARRAALDVLAAAGLPGADAALARLGAGSGGDLADEARSLGVR